MFDALVELVRAGRRSVDQVAAADISPGARFYSEVVPPKYLLWRELTDTYLAGHSVLVYQHFPRRDHQQYIDHMSQRIADVTGATEVLAFRTAHVVFFLAPQHSETEFYADRISVVNAQWKNVIDSVLVAVA